ncbi:alpha/beta hydrolase-fold protein [Streptomyces sp. ME02-8801-2C]|uniref:alpha/beta hydrolase n=1 Tax=Streptomyces sp. ME02-8801-2C TaxID=3028680 RepID=UPI0029A49CCB|nr:alpha/beta hydrolase-fold protein [Streptomyces sp. ME02-8801-2C]MDX3456288.1 alpha/beta hydrolase-fold protein [Streptomyces sp. ME02-8801-2C]
MGLTSKTVLALAILAATLLFLGTIVFWPRLARPNWRAVGGRTALLLATQVAVFVSVGLAVNQSFGFYASWDDLLGKETDQGVVVDQSTGAHRGFQVLSTQSVDVPGGHLPRVGGQIQKIGVVGKKTGITSPAYVYLPPEYFQRQYAKRNFPVVVVLTGYPGTAQALVSKLNFPDTAHKLARDGRAQPMILVMLRPTVAPPRDTECVDVPGGPQTETFFARDLPAALASHYRVGPGPGGWGIIGDSTGGYCALKIAMHHPRAYTAAVGLSPYYRAPVDATTGDLFQGDKRLEREADLEWYAKNMPAPDVSLLVTTSRHGETNYAATMRFVDLVKVRAPTRISTIVLESGGHNFNTWRREIPASLEWLSQRLTER